MAKLVSIGEDKTKDHRTSIAEEEIGEGKCLLRRAKSNSSLAGAGRWGIKRLDEGERKGTSLVAGFAIEAEM